MFALDLNKFERRVFDALFPEGDPRREKILGVLIKAASPDNMNPRLQLVEEFFSIDWCRENALIPLEMVSSDQQDNDTLLVAIGNITFLGTIGEFIKLRASQKGYKVQFIEKDPNLIQFLLDEVVSGTGSS